MPNAKQNVLGECTYLSSPAHPIVMHLCHKQMKVITPRQWLLVRECLPITYMSTFAPVSIHTGRDDQVVQRSCISCNQNKTLNEDWLEPVSHRTWPLFTGLLLWCSKNSYPPSPLDKSFTCVANCLSILVAAHLHVDVNARIFGKKTQTCWYLDTFI